MTYFRSFIPWIAYALLAGPGHRTGAALVGLALAVHEVHSQERRHGNVDDLTLAARWFFLGLVAVCFVASDSPVLPYVPALSLATLGAVAAWSVFDDHPFTTTIARRTTPEEVWDLPLFTDVNRRISTAWALSLLATAAVCAALIAVAPAATGLWVTAEAIGFATPVVWTAVERRAARSRFTVA